MPAPGERPELGRGSEVIDARAREEYRRRAEELRGELAEARELLERDPVLQRSIRLRNPYVDPMSVLQVDLLGRWRASDRSDDALLDALLSTVNGIARGLQNTG